MAQQSVPKKVKALTTRYVRLLNERKMTDADKILETIRDRLTTAPWHQGYYNALEGIATALKSKDNQFLYINRLNPKEKTRMTQLQKEFSMHSRSPLLGDFDRGYFTAWLEYLRVMKAPDSAEKLTEYLATP